MKEERRNKRISVDGLDVMASSIYSTEVEVHNISPTGISISGPKRLTIGGVYTLRLALTESVLAIKGIVRWEKLVGSRKGEMDQIVPIYMAGLEFKDVLTDKALLLIDLIKQITGVTEQRLQGIRFKILEHEKAVLNYVENYIVRIISLNGILIESANILPVEKRIYMELSLPEDDKTVRFTGRIVSCLETMEDHTRRYKIGIEFSDMSEDDKTRLNAFIVNPLG